MNKSSIMKKMSLVAAVYITSLCYGQHGPFPIQFSISNFKIIENIPEKNRDFAHLIPAQEKTYIYTDESAYRKGYQDSYFAITCKKGGWDCMRHYEILANGCIPYFVRLEQCNPKTMELLPRELILEAMNLPGVPKIDAADPRDINPAQLKIDHTVFDTQRYYEILAELLAYTRKHLTTQNMARYVLDTIGYQGSGKILFLSKDTDPDYLRGCVLIGLKQLFGDRIIDVPKIPHIYTNYAGDITKIYGKGFSYSRVVDDFAVDRGNIEQRIRNKEFDLIVYGSVHRGLLFHSLVTSTYAPDKIVYVCGEDAHRCQYKHYNNLFLREFDALS